MKRITELLTVCFMLSLLSACGDTNDNKSDSGSGGAKNAAVGKNQAGHLNFGCYNYSDSLDPATNTNSSWAGMRFGITEALFKFSKQVEAEPNICDEYTVSDDYKTWKLHIRKGVKFSNGNEVTATAVKNSIQRLYDQTDPEKGGTGNSVPRGYLVYESISADDEAGTVTITCDKATSNIPGILAYPYFAIIDTTVIDKETIGTGPYKVIKFNPGISVDLARNEHYWNGEVPFDTAAVIFINDSSTKAMALQSGDIDLVENITTASDLEKMKANPNYHVSVAPGVRTAKSYMNFHGALGNKALRQAIQMALDKKTMCDVTVGGMYTAGYSVLPSSLAYNYDKLNNPYPFDKQAAIKILDEAGIVDTDGDGFRELDGKMINLDHVSFTSRNLDEFAEASALQLAEIGIKTTVNIRDYDTVLALQNAGQFDLNTCNTLTVGVGDPQDFLANWYSGNSKSFGFFSNPQYDAAYEKLMVELDDDRRLELITELQQILIDEAAVIVFGYYNSSMISNVKKVTGADIATIDYYWLTTDIKPVK